MRDIGRGRLKTNVFLVLLILLFLHIVSCLYAFTKEEEKAIFAVFDAIKKGDIVLVESLLNQGVSVNTQWYSETFLVQALIYKQPDIARLLILKGADVNGVDVNVEDISRYSPLGCAADIGYKDIVLLLLEKGANVNPVKSWKPLNNAVKGEHVEIVKILLNKGADVNATGEYSGTPLAIAAEKGNVEIVKLLLEAGACPGLGDLLYAAQSGNIEIMTMILPKFEKPAEKEKALNEALLKAAGYSSLKTIQFLLENGADLKYKDESGLTLLMYAVSGRKKDIVEFCIDKGVDVINKDKIGKNSLVYAIRPDNIEIINILIDAGVKINDVPVLEFAARCGYTDVVKLLIEKGADLNQINNGTTATPLIGAVQQSFASRGGFDVVELLIEKGADVNLKDRNGKTALIYAKELDNKYRSWPSEEKVKIALNRNKKIMKLLKKAAKEQKL